MADQLVLDAVTTENARSKRGVLQKLFALWFDAFVYNQIWEDPRVDLAALELNERSRVLTISSGGCNALNYLLEGPASVTAVDLNRHHIYLLNLKIAAVKHLPRHEDFYEFFGCGSGPNANSNYVRFIAGHLDPDTRAFWESNSLFGGLLSGDRIGYFSDGGLYEHSRNAYFLRFFHWISRRLGCEPAAVLNARTLAEQRSIYEGSIRPFFANPIIKLIGKMPVTLFGLGIPPQQYEELRKDLDGEKTIIDIYEERTRRLACDFPIHDNYFAWQAFARTYDNEYRNAVPEYLKEQNFDLLRSNIMQLNAVVGSVTDVIRDSSYAAFDRFVFLDAQDWMNTASLIDLWTAVADRAASGSRIIFRTAGSKSPIEGVLPSGLADRFIYESELSGSLFLHDRASIYGGFHLYVVK